jgi:hypothetical protein
MLAKARRTARATFNALPLENAGRARIATAGVGVDKTMELLLMLVLSRHRSQAVETLQLGDDRLLLLQHLQSTIALIDALHSDDSSSCCSSVASVSSAAH